MSLTNVTINILENAMTEIKRFEDLKCWQEARILVKQIFSMAARSELSQEYTLVNQLKRASLSAMTNIAEGFSRCHKKDFIRFLDYSQSSSQEVKSLLYVVHDMKLMSDNHIKAIQKQCEKTKKLTLGLLKHIKETLPEYGNTIRETEFEYEYEVPTDDEGWQLSK